MLRSLISVFAITLAASAAQGAEPLPRQLEGVGVDEQLGEQIDLSLTFTDHAGRTVRLADYVSGDVPVLLTLNYYGCPMLCGLQLNGLTDSLKQFDWTPGENFRVVTISFDPSEGPELAAAKRDAHLRELGRGDVEWSFLTGDEASIRALSDSLGYGFRYVEAQEEYAHPAAFMFISPEGMISRYLYGFTLEPRDVRFALIEASEGRVGSTMEQLFFSCFMYDPNAGSYVKNAMMFMRLGGALTIAALAALLITLWRRESTRPSPETV